MKKIAKLFAIMLLILTVLISCFLSPHITEDWIEVAETPKSEEGCKPQGLCYYKDNIYITIHCDDQESLCYKYSYSSNIDSLKVVGKFVFPDEYAHISGIEFVYDKIYSVDYNSNTLLVIDPKKSFKSGEAHVLKTYKTGLEGTSAICIAEDKYIVVSDFPKKKKLNNFLKLTRNTFAYIMSIDVPLVDDVIADKFKIRYKNVGYSQGLTYHDGLLFETSAGLSKSKIVTYDFDLLLKGEVKVKQKISFPTARVEDVCVVKNYLLTTCEETFILYKLKLK